MFGTSALRLEDVVRTKKVGSLVVAVVLGVLFVWTAWQVRDAFLYVVSGRLFLSPFDRAHVGGALDQPSLTKAFFIFMFAATFAVPFVAACRSIANRSTRLGRRLFTIGATSVCVLVAGLVTIPFWWTIQYIAAMGVTERRIEGLIFSALCYAALTAFLRWAVRPPRERAEAEEQLRT